MTTLSPINGQSITLAKPFLKGESSFQTVGKFKNTSNGSGIVGSQIIAIDPHSSSYESMYINVSAEPTLITDRSAQGKENIYEYTVISRGIDSDNKSIPPTLTSTSNEFNHESGAEVSIVVSAEHWQELKTAFDENVATKFAEMFCFDDATSIGVGDGRVYFLVPSKFNNTNIEKAVASVITPGITGTLDIQVARGRNSGFIGDSTTQFDITNPSGTIFRYTYDGTGTDPIISDIEADDYVNIQAQNFNTSNNGWYKVVSTGLNYFEIENASGVAENDKTIGTGGISVMNWRDTFTTKLTIDSNETSSSSASTPVVIDPTIGNVQTNDLLRVDIDVVHTTPAKGLIINLEFTG